MYRHHTILSLALSLAVFLIVGSATAEGADQRNHRTVGIAASFQGSQYDILVPIWANDQLVVTPSLGITSVSGAVVDYRFGVMFRYNFRVDKAVPYLGVRIVNLLQSPQGGQSVSDQIIGPAVGGEYFFDPHFSIGVEAQLNVAISGTHSIRFGNPDGTNVNTAAALVAAFYF